MFCTFCYHGDCHVEQAKPEKAHVCIYNACSCANCSAISRAQPLYEFNARNRKKKKKTPTIPSTACLIFLIFPSFLSFSTNPVSKYHPSLCCYTSRWQGRWQKNKEERKRRPRERNKLGLKMNIIIVTFRCPQTSRALVALFTNHFAPCTFQEECGIQQRLFWRKKTLVFFVVF